MITKRLARPLQTSRMTGKMLIGTLILHVQHAEGIVPGYPPTIVAYMFADWSPADITMLFIQLRVHLGGKVLTRSTGYAVPAGDRSMTLEFGAEQSMFGWSEEAAVCMLTRYPSRRASPDEQMVSNRVHQLSSWT